MNSFKNESLNKEYIPGLFLCWLKIGITIPITNAMRFPR